MCRSSLAGTLIVKPELGTQGEGIFLVQSGESASPSACRSVAEWWHGMRQRGPRSVQALERRLCTRRQARAREAAQGGRLSVPAAFLRGCPSLPRARAGAPRTSARRLPFRTLPGSGQSCRRRNGTSAGGRPLRRARASPSRLPPSLVGQVQRGRFREGGWLWWLVAALGTLWLASALRGTIHGVFTLGAAGLICSARPWLPAAGS